MGDFLELRIIRALKSLLSGRVNEILREDALDIPLIEFSDYNGHHYHTVPVIALSSCERTEKERVIRIAAYTVTISFALPETYESEEQCYAYSEAVCRALKETPTLGGLVDRARMTGEKYALPKPKGAGGSWRVELSLRVTVGEQNR